MYIILFSIIIFLLIILSFYYKNFKKLKEEQNLTIEELWESKKDRYDDEIEKFNLRKEEILKEYNREKQSIELKLNNLHNEERQILREIQNKKDFNNSLLKIREEELDRLIEEKRKEKEKVMESRLKLEEKQKIELLNADFFNFVSEQEKVKEQILQDLDKVRNELEDFRIQREAVNQAILREKELQEKENFYKIDISETDKEDILVLRGIAPQLKNKEALNKLIYEVFIRRPLIELIKRVTGGRSISGIYKITYIKTGEAYIGRTTDIQTRWQNHCKTACGLDGAAHTTFHTRLEKDGIWNYTFEILEEVSKDKLNEREKFYIDLYGTDTQLNSKKGG